MILIGKLYDKHEVLGIRHSIIVLYILMSLKLSHIQLILITIDSCNIFD